MNIKGIFVIVKEKQEALDVFDNMNARYHFAYVSGNSQRIAYCKAYCNAVVKAIKECFDAEMYGPSRCIKFVELYKMNDDINRVSWIFTDVCDMVIKLRMVIYDSVPISMFPSCKRLSEWSVSDAISAVSDLG